MKERDRLLLVKTDVAGRVEKLTGEVSGLKVTHQRELDALLRAQTEVEEELQKEREAGVKKLEDIFPNHQREFAAAKTRADVALAGIHEMDDKIAGKLLNLL